MIGAGTLATLGVPLPIMAGPFDNPNFDANIPADKKLSPDWVKTLFERGEPEVFHGLQLDKIRLPIGGICAGHVYLNGQGMMVDWRLNPYLIQLQQGFALRTVVDGKSDLYPLNGEGFPDLTFRGEYPIAQLDYKSAAVPVETSVEVFSPYIPLHADDSGLPATIYSFTLKNVSNAPVEATLAGELQNGVCIYNRFCVDAIRRNQIVRSPGTTMLACTVAHTATERPAIIFEDWDRPTYAGWTVEGMAFGSGPIERAVVERQLGSVGGKSPRLVNSFLASKGNQGTGKLTSAPFTISRNYINIWIGGGNLEGKTCVNLLIDGKVVQSLTGNNDNKLSNRYFDVHEFEGRQAQFEIVDASDDNWGQIGVGRIAFVDVANEGVSSDQRPPIIFEDWDKPTYEGWTVEGAAFGSGPIEIGMAEHKMGRGLGGEGAHVVNSYIANMSDRGTGKLTSAPFTISRRYINIWIGGGDLEGRTCVNLLVDGKVVQSQTGARDEKLSPRCFIVHDLEGKQAQLEIVDSSDDVWGHIGVGRIAFADRPGNTTPLDELPDYGSMALTLLGAPAELCAARGSIGLDGEPSDNVFRPLAETLTGSLGRTVQLKSGESATVNFLVTWHFPNLTSDRLGNVGRYYAQKFDSAQAVADYVGTNFSKLADTTRLWRDTWYDSTLPYWFLDRTMINASTLATSGCMRFLDGRFWAWEGGPDCCGGTCTHVWQYAHSMGRLFPELERDTRERVDLGLALNHETGVSGYRGEFGMSLAVDGQTGTILRIYREHQMSPDNAFLKRNWDNIKLMYKPLFALDPNGEGIMDGEQMNTLDRPWYGQISWMSSMYSAACRAGERMAMELGDGEFAEKCGRIASNGFKNIGARLYNGEYFFNIIDPKHADTVNSGDGSYIDQVYGQSWGFQLGLPRILPEKETRTALHSLWTYNFSPNAGAFLASKKMGRQFVTAGDAGMIMCTFPRTDWNLDQASGGDPAHRGGFAYYLVETWTGQEYQVAGHMFWEGMVLEPLAVVRAIHDRYNPLKRNPYSEIECGEHYSRAMASHGAFIGICGYEHHGPLGHIGFAPRLNPEKFRAPFTVAEGWGTYAQTIADGKMEASLELKWGQLQLRTMNLTLDPVPTTPMVQAILGSSSISAACSVVDGRVNIQFPSGVTIRTGQKLTLEVS